MALLDTILAEGGGALIGQLAKKLNIDEKSAESALKGLTPALTRGLQRNTSNEKGLGSLLNAIEKDTHAGTLRDFDKLGLDDMTKEGNDVLGHILGSKDVSRNVAGHVAKQSGLGAGLLKKALPIVAMVVMGMLKSKGGGSLRKSRSSGGGLIRSMLDSDNDGSIIDDVLSLAVKLF